MSKKRFLSCLLTVFLLFSVIFGVITVSAKQYDGFSIDIPDRFTVVTSKDDLSDFSKKVGISAENLKSYFSDGEYKLLAVDDGNTTQIKLSSKEDEFSKKTINFNNFEEADLITLGESFLTVKDAENESNITVVKNNDFKFIKIVEAHKDSGGVYTVTQYITVVDGKTYKLSIFIPSDADKQLEQEVFNSFIIEQNKGFQFTFSHLLIIIAIMLFVALIVLSIVNIVKSKNIVIDDE
ncbi:MAG: hypothetical protein E7561_04185 [Ruminococcaceae bacterium]|nr:hypothetical protein [Oscillospiraceae bacterium]